MKCSVDCSMEHSMESCGLYVQEDTTAVGRSGWAITIRAIIIQVVVFEGGAFEQHSGATTHSGLSEHACGLSRRWGACHACGVPFEDATAAQRF